MKLENIWIIDDDPISTFVSEQVCVRAGIKSIFKYSDPYKALNDIKNHLSIRPKLILLDVMMPVLSGFDFMAQLDPTEFPIKIVLISALPLHMVKEESVKLDSRVLAFWLKPLDVNTVTAFAETLKTL